MLCKKLFYFFYYRKKRGLRRELRNVNYENAQTLLLVVNIISKEDVDELQQLISKLFSDKKNFRILLFAKKKEGLHLLPNDSITYVTKKDISFCHMPKSRSSLSTILNHTYDLYIDLTQERSLLFLWLAQFNLAKFKIGFDRFQEKVFDINVALPSLDKLFLANNFDIFVSYLSWFGK